MHRQSLGSPSTKLYSHGGGGGGREDKLNEEERKRKDGVGAEGRPVALEEHNKAEKLHRSAAGVEKSIHLIPILLIFCFLVLYLCSHDPAQKDLADFTGFRRPSKLIDADSTAIDDFRRFLDLDKADALAIRSHRSLHEIGKRRSEIPFPQKARRFLIRINGFLLLLLPLLSLPLSPLSLPFSGLARASPLPLRSHVLNHRPPISLVCFVCTGSSYVF